MAIIRILCYNIKIRKVIIMNSLSITQIVKRYLLELPGDRILTYVTRKGTSVVSKIDTHKGHATYREYYKKDGTPGKRILILKES